MAGAFALLLLACVGPRPAAAQMSSAGGYTLTRMESDVTVEPDATLDVQETITGEFFEERHGLYRSIPVRYVAENGTRMSLPFSVVSVTRDGNPEPFKAYRDGDNEVIKVGDPDQTISGPFSYGIHYRVARAVLFEDKTDQVYWNATGTDWAVPIPETRATVRVAGVAKDQFNAVCYTGPTGSRAQNCAFSFADGAVSFSAKDFLTVAVRFPKGVVTPPPAWQGIIWWLADNWSLLFWLVPLGAALFLYRQWRRSGKDAKGRGTIIPEYDPPDALRPTEVGMLVDARVDQRDLSAVFVDLAVRGYLRIVEKEEKGLVFSSRAYTLEKQKDGDGLKPFERLIFDETFSGGDAKTLKQTDGGMAGAIQQASDRVYQDMTEAGYFADNPKKVMGLYFGVGVAIAFAGFFFGDAVVGIAGSPHALFALFATAALFCVAAPFMRKRTEKGALAREQALGFKLFLETAERYRLQWQEREGIFEKFLPYAMVFGVADKWTKAFEGMNLPQPTWYVGAYPGFVFQPNAFARDLGGFAAAAAAVHAPSSRSGGGFGGGGFSGGGFGGGGGGSW